MTLNLFQTGALVRCPGGGPGENPDVAKANGIEWFALNLGADPCVKNNPAVWDGIRARCKAAEMPVGPWMHCHSMADIEFLVNTGIAWNSPLIGCNIEDVVEDKLDLRAVGGYLLDFWVNPRSPYFGHVHMPSLAWLQNGQGWGHVSFATIALEMFPEVDPRYLADWQRCIDHAFAEGAQRVTLLYSTQSPRSVYPAAVAHCLYTADNAGSWPAWKDTVPQVPPVPPAPPPTPEVPMLTVAKFPYTGPLPPGVQNRATVKGLKRAMIRLDYLQQPLGSETDDWGPDLTAAMRTWWKEEVSSGTKWTGYGKGSWYALRSSKLTQGPNAGQYAMDAKACAYVREDALTKCYPHPAGVSGVYIGQGPHQTDGLPWTNIAIDFMAPGGTKVLAVEAAEVTKLSGNNPAEGWHGPGIFGWTIYYRTPAGYEYFSTHYGTRLVKKGQQVDCGQVIGEVGHWPGDPGRSHTHLGVSSPNGRADATKRILEISQAKKITV